MCRKVDATVICCLVSLLASCDRPADRVSGPAEPEGPALAAMSNTWVAKHTISPWRQDAEATTISGLVYLVGGRKADGRAIARLDAYDVATDRWTNLPPMPGARYQANGASMVNGKLYLSGGVHSSGPAPPRLSVFDPAAPSW